MQDIFGLVLDERQGGGRRSAAEAGELLQDRASRGGQEAQLAQHKVHDVVGVLFGAYPLEVPTPASSVTVESEQPFIRKCGHKLDGEERISGGLFMHQTGQGPNLP